jgi:hypothetical protein
MDEFQKDFFLFRQSEWQDYRAEHPTVLQGNLNDPLYFDFISFAQYVVLSNSFKNAKDEFIEKNGAEGVSSVIRRNNGTSSASSSSSSSGGDDLRGLHGTMVGQRIYE